MTEYQLQRDQFIPRPLDDVFAFFADAANLERITPPWLKFRIVTPTPITMAAVTRIDYQIRWRFVRLKWTTEIVDWEPNHRFTDTQIHGPYVLWHHTHTFESRDGGTHMHDLVRYRLPLGPLGKLAHRLQVQRDLARIFDYRAAEIAKILDKT
jgi:ligand-binding SRPBCC domain-containing protein